MDSLTYYFIYCLAMSQEHYFGNAINWRKFQDGLREIMNEHKPGVILIEKTWCSSCKKVGAKFQQDSELLELSKDFVMISCVDDEEPDYDEFRPGTINTVSNRIDGSYYPRFFFVDKNGNIDYSIASQPEGGLYRYYYSSPSTFKENMKKVLDRV